MRVYDYVISGAGMGGTTFARLLQHSRVDNFLLLERGDESGGLCRSRPIDGHVVDTKEGGFRYAKYEEVYRFVFNHMPREAFNRFGRLSANGESRDVLALKILRSACVGNWSITSRKITCCLTTERFEAWAAAASGSISIQTPAFMTRCNLLCS